MTDSTPRTEADWKRKAELQDAIIEAVRSADGVGGIKAFQAYDDFIEAQARTEALDVRTALTFWAEGWDGMIAIHSDGDECTGLLCGNPEHGWASLAAEPPALDVDVVKMLRRVAGISYCSQTHHEFLGRDAAALLARLTREETT
jgi:hypothetical protein